MNVLGITPARRRGSKGIERKNSHKGQTNQMGKWGQIFPLDKSSSFANIDTWLGH